VVIYGTLAREPVLNAGAQDFREDASFPSGPESGGPSGAAVRQTLKEILSSLPFRTSNQCQSLLKYIVMHSLAGQGELLRERVIGAEIFGRKPDYDPGTDPVVRARAAEVRKRLAQFYASDESAGCTVQIQIPSGSYRAQWEWREPFTPAPRSESTSLVSSPNEANKATEAPIYHEDSPVAGDKPAPRQPWMVRHWRGITLVVGASACGLLVLFLAGVGRGAFVSPSHRAYSDFWAPLIHQPQPTLICAGTNPAYILPMDAQEKFAEEHHIQNNGADFVVDLKEHPEIVATLTPTSNGLLRKEDATALIAITNFLARQNYPYQLRFGQDVLIEDVRERPVIMLGAFNNRWTLRMNDSMRYVFAGGVQIANRADSKQSWTQTKDTDYAIVSRVFDSKTDGVLLTVAGIGEMGTLAAAKFITDPQQIALLYSKAPSGWQNKNLEVVLSTDVLDNSPSKAKILATYFW
jgi:hypothetical protein